MVLVREFKKRFHAVEHPQNHPMLTFCSIITPCISDQDNVSLLGQVTEREIWNAVNSIGALKAPGSDGLHAIFYQTCWNEVRDPVLKLVKNFFDNGTSLNLINHTNIALIPKKDTPETVNDYRPISLCNVSYKIITKIIIGRLKPLLEKCISRNQGAFAPGRAIQDNILIAHELFSDFQRKKGNIGNIAVKIDLEKAYDLISWQFIEACLKRFGFNSDWINLVMKCISSTSFSILVNGTANGWFKPNRGLRQGDPLSPYIFILVMEPLIRHLNSLATSHKTHVGILSSPLGFRISNLMFADDCLIFGKASKKSARNIVSVLNDFSAASGQKINYHKSSIYFSPRVPASLKQAITNTLNIQHKTTIGKYLGIHNVIFWKDPVNAKEILLKMAGKLSGWKKGTLSRSGRLTLIKSNLASMPNHVMSCFKCPKILTDKIDRQGRDFFWGPDMKSPPVAWTQVCMPRTFGGLGIRPAAFFNNAALAKLAWKVCSDHNNWWTQIVRKKYLRNSSFFQVKKKQSSSLAWKGVLDARELVLKGMRWIVGNGRMIKFWTFNWAFDFPLCNLLNDDQKRHVNWAETVADYITEEKCSPLDLIVLAWQIWKARNDLIFKGITTVPHSVVAASLTTLHASTTLQGPSLTTLNQPPRNIRWYPPKQNMIKINFDGSVKSRAAASGFIFRDHLGNPLLASAMSSGHASVPIAEATALRDSLAAAMDKGFQFLEVEGDSKLVIDAVNGVSHPPWRLRKVIQDIRSLATSFSTIIFKHVFREANFAADAVTTLGHLYSDRVWWANRFPHAVTRAILFDSVNGGGQRGLPI